MEAMALVLLAMAAVTLMLWLDDKYGILGFYDPYDNGLRSLEAKGYKFADRVLAEGNFSHASYTNDATIIHFENGNTYLLDGLQSVNLNKGEHFAIVRNELHTPGETQPNIDSPILRLPMVYNYIPDY